MTLIPFENDYLKLISSCRSTTPELKPQVFSTTNPGEAGHAWVVKRFVDHGNLNSFRDPETGRNRIFISATIDDNPTLQEADPAYVGFLDGLKTKDPNLYKAWRLGDWDIYVGQAFSMLQRDVHIIKEKELGRVEYFAGYDYGFQHPFAFILLCVDMLGDVYVVDYVSKQQLEAEEHGELINEMVENIEQKNITCYTSPDAYAEKNKGPSIVERLRAKCPKMSFVRANDDRVRGVAEMRKYFTIENGKPKCFFFDGCTEIFDQLLSIQYDPKKKENVVKRDADENGENGDDLFDCLRYGMFSRIYPTNPEPKKKTDYEKMVELIEEKEYRLRHSYDL